MIVTVVNHKGGVTKTTSAVHLAGFLALEFGEGSTALIDTDPNEGALEWAARGEELGFTLPFGVYGPEDDPQEEHVVYDSQGRLFGEDLEAVAEFSDVTVVPTTVDGVPVNTLMRFMDDVRDLGAEERCRVLLTRVPNRWSSLRGTRTRRALEGESIPLFAGHIRERVALQDAGTLGAMVYEMKGKGAREAWEDYVRVGRELIGGRG